ncbi:MAG: O-antigen ligase family protein [Pirellulales bacterium]|nr:O-antigen ligase family protein [Pirellulales bacterium]
MKGLIFTYVMTYGGAVVALVNPFIGLLIYISFAIIKPESLWHWAVPRGNYSRILAIAFLIGWALQGFGNWNFGRARPVVWALLGYWGWMVLSAAAAPEQTLAWAFVESQSKILLPVLVGMTLVDSVAKLKQIAWAIMLSQGLVALEMNLAYLAGRNRVVETGFGGMDNNCVSIAMVTGCGLAFFLGLGQTVWWKRWGSFAAAGLMAHIPMISMSRGGMLALCVLGVVAFVLIPKQPKHYALFLLALVIGIRLAGPQVLDRFSMVFADTEERDSSAANRIKYWGYCCEIMVEQPALGAGPGNYRLAATERHPESIPERADLVEYAHSLWFETGAELGFPGLGFLLAFYLSTVWMLWRLLRSGAPLIPFATDSARMVIAALAGFGVSVSFVSLSGLEIPFYVVLLGAGTVKLAGQNALCISPTRDEWRAVGLIGSVDLSPVERVLRPGG